MINSMDSFGSVMYDSDIINNDNALMSSSDLISF